LLSGEKRAEYTEATTMQLYDLRARCWSRETLQRLELPDCIFQEIVLPGTVLGELLPEIQSECGFAGGVPCIAVASHDTASAVAAIPEFDDSSAFLSSGTWSLMGVAVDEPNLSDAAFHAGFTNEGAAGGRVLLMKNMTGLWILQECVRAWEAAGNRFTWPELEQAAASAPAFRSFIDPSASAFQSPADMCAAIALSCAESSTARSAEPRRICALRLREPELFLSRSAGRAGAHYGRDTRSIRIVGGGCLNQLPLPDDRRCMRREVIAGPVEAAALGNAMMQAVATGHIKNLSEGQAALRQSVELQSYQPTQSGCMAASLRALQITRCARP
jgi:rhamnulokinase